MIDLTDVTFSYGTSPVLANVNLHIPEGELVLVAGPTGSGKSTLLGLLNGLVPHFSGGTLRGRVTVGGLSTAEHPPREFAAGVGVVGQDPLAGFVTDTVEEELAYGMEQLAVPAAVMRKRVEETLDLLGIAELRDRGLRTLSGGQQQRVAIGSVLAAGPRVLVLDEPTSALDPTSAEDVIAAVVRLVHDLGITVLMAEHRMERVAQYADRLVIVRGDGTVESGDPVTLMATSPIVPPVVELGRLADWSPLALSIRDARRLAGPLRDRLAGSAPVRRPVSTAQPLVRACGLTVRYGSVIAVREVDLLLRPAETTVVMGRNGSGKSSLLWALTGALKRSGGTVDVRGEDPAGLTGGSSRRLLTLVPQTAADLLYLNTVAAECAAADAESQAIPGTCRTLAGRIAGPLAGEANPRDLSEGQRLGLVLAIQLTGAPAVILLDEPTRGLDYRAKARLAAVLSELSDEGKALLIATHDVEFAAQLADRVLVMAQGEIVVDGPALEVLAASPSLAPQVAKVLFPEPWLTVDQVARALSDTVRRGRPC